MSDFSRDAQVIQMPPNAGLIIIDVQKGFDHPKWGSRNNPDAEQRIAALLAAWRNTRRPIFHVQHLSRLEDSPLHPQNPGCQIKELVRPGENEPVFQKSVNSAFIGSSLEDSLRKSGIQTVVIVGLTTPHCISTSARMAGNLGFDVYLPSDAIAAFDIVGPDGTRHLANEVHKVSLATLHGEFATVVDSKTLLASVQQT
jgi:nicotinamidase-related amidase